ncbi:MAG: DUF2851 family protein [Flavobacteriales bacterium]|nr:DUF2851 family protein [Flavobacteriales bacterium]
MERIPEKYIHYLWRYGLFDTTDLSTTEGDPVLIEHPGFPNHHAGPDFLNAHIRIGERQWVGSVEIHFKASDWLAHGHSQDRAYDNVILHVVIHADRSVVNTHGSTLPTLSLEPYVDEEHFRDYERFIQSKRWIPCAQLIHRVDPFKWTVLKERMAVERLAAKAAGLIDQLKSLEGDWEELAYRTLARVMGSKVNAAPFEHLASKVPLAVVRKHADNGMQMQAMYLGQAGFLEGDELFVDDHTQQLLAEYLFLKSKYGLIPMDKVEWRAARIRPSSAPQIRIVQFAELIQNQDSLLTTVLESDLESILKTMSVSLGGYWREHIGLGRKSTQRKRSIGASLKDRIAINIIGPLRYAYGVYSDEVGYRESALSLLEEIAAEDNRIIRNWKQSGVEVGNAMDSQALLQQKMSFCDQKRCLDCAIGQELLRGDEKVSG